MEWLVKIWSGPGLPFGPSLLLVVGSYLLGALVERFGGRGGF